MGVMADTDAIRDWRGASASMPRDRIWAAILTVVIHVLLLLALLSGLGVPVASRVENGLVLLDLTRPPPPREKLAPDPRQSARRAGRASPPNLKARATVVVMPPPIVPPVVPPPPVVTAKVAGTGGAAASGNAAVAGPGTGSGGIGDGTGSGGAGDGDGDGGDRPPRLIRGRIKPSDYDRPEDDFADRVIEVQYVVATDGRVTMCEIVRSSGAAVLDARICPLIRERFRFDPSRDAVGRPVQSEVSDRYRWIAPPPPPPGRERR